MECERCCKSRESGQSYHFHFGTKGPRSTRFELGARVDTTLYRMAGTASAWICDRCVRQRQASQWGTVFLLCAPIILLVVVLIRVNELDVATGLCWSAIPLGASAWIVASYGSGTRQTSGEELAIGLKKGDLRRQGYDTFLTTRQYEKLH